MTGRRLFHTVDGTGGRSSEMGYGAQQAGSPPFFVVTHKPPQEVRLERELGMSVTFTPATDGDVVIMGSNDVHITDGRHTGT